MAHLSSRRCRSKWSGAPIGAGAEERSDSGCGYCVRAGGVPMSGSHCACWWFSRSLLVVIVALATKGGKKNGVKCSGGMGCWRRRCRCLQRSEVGASVAVTRGVNRSQRKVRCWGVQRVPWVGAPPHLPLRWPPPSPGLVHLPVIAVVSLKPNPSSSVVFWI